MALNKYVDEFVQQAAVMSIDWWDKLKPLRINIKGKTVTQYFKPIPEFIDSFGMPFPTVRQAAYGWVQAFAKIEGGEVTTASQVVGIVLKETATHLASQPLLGPHHGPDLSQASERSFEKNQSGLSSRPGWHNS